MRHRRDIANDRDVEPDGLQGAHCGFASGARPLDPHFHFLQSVSHCLPARILRDHLRGVRGAFARAFETDFACARPADHAALQVGDRDDGVVESCQHVRDAGVNILAALGLDDLRQFDCVGIK